MDRRKFVKNALLGGSLIPFMQLAHAVEIQGQLNNTSNKESKLSSSKTTSLEEKQRSVNQIPKGDLTVLVNEEELTMHGNEEIAMLLYPGFTALDLAGPQYLFASMLGAKVHLVSPTDEIIPVKTDTGFSIMPTVSQKDCPEKLDLLFVPGSASGVLESLQNSVFIDFVRQKATNTKYLTSVCTGSLILGKAGLLKDKKATSHWLTMDLLPRFGAIPMKDKVVCDGNVITGGCITAGIDFGLKVLTALRGERYAEVMQLVLEYSPELPFKPGVSDEANPLVTKSVQNMFAPLLVDIESVI